MIVIATQSRPGLHLPIESRDRQWTVIGCWDKINAPALVVGSFFSGYSSLV
jgi:hypothetical protein